MRWTIYALTKYVDFAPGAMRTILLFSRCSRRLMRYSGTMLSWAKKLPISYSAGKDAIGRSRALPRAPDLVLLLRPRSLCVHCPTTRRGYIPCQETTEGRPLSRRHHPGLEAACSFLWWPCQGCGASLPIPGCSVASCARTNGKRIKQQRSFLVKENRRRETATTRARHRRPTDSRGLTTRQPTSPCQQPLSQRDSKARGRNPKRKEPAVKTRSKEHQRLLQLMSMGVLLPLSHPAAAATA
mmetsp:Transcript_9969/g.28766  ORF Transcript_9969/g.28766 Transcript_9969/m.28766 type:complete len:241 (-) Transcript_9969:807-1529(-)